MDIVEFKSRLLKSRTFEVDHELDIDPGEGAPLIKGRHLGAKFTLRQPGEQEFQRVFIKHRRPDGTLADEDFPVVQFEIARLAIVGWQDVRGRMLDPGAKFDGEVPFDPELVDVLLEANFDLVAALAGHVLRRRNERATRREDDRKNSGRVSSTSGETSTKETGSRSTASAG